MIYNSVPQATTDPKARMTYTVRRSRGSKDFLVMYAGEFPTKDHALAWIASEPEANKKRGWKTYVGVEWSNVPITDPQVLARNFFFINAGWSYDPKTERPYEGRLRCARALAEAEAHFKTQDWSFDICESGELYGWQGDTFDVVDSSFEGETFDGYGALLTDASGNFLASLGEVTFAKNDPHTDPYMRVVRAELALQAMQEANR